MQPYVWNRWLKTLNYEPRDAYMSNQLFQLQEESVRETQ